MKKILTPLILIPGLILTVLSTKTVAESLCFMQGANGEQINLGQLCGNQSPQPQAASSKSGVFQIPIKRREGGIPVVDVTFNGNKTFEMLLDTGASAITINPQMAKTLGVRPESSVNIGTANGTIPVGVGRVNSVKAGGLIRENLAVVISPSLPSIGLLGQNFFGNHDVTIKQKVIELRTRHN